MSATTLRRLESIRHKLSPKRRIVVVQVPLADAPPEEGERYRQEMAMDAETRIVVEHVMECLP